jgi:glycine/D-amino acid oxidase-like deaminating enzyme
MGVISIPGCEEYMAVDATQKTVGIVGAGIIGVQIARALQRRGAQVTLFDPNDPGTGTSFGNAGYIATEAIFPLAHGAVLRSLPRMLLNPLGPLSMRWKEFPRLLPWYLKYAHACSRRRAADSIDALASIQREAASAWHEVKSQEGLARLIVTNGAMMVYESDRGFNNTRLQREVQRHYGINWETLSGDDARSKIPELSSRIKHAVIYPAGMHVVNPYTVTKTILQRFLADGGEYSKLRVDAIETRAGSVDAIRAGSTQYRFDTVVVSAGHLSGRLLKPLHYKVPIVAERGYHVEMSHRETRLNMPVGAYERGFHITPMTSGLRLAGTTEFSSADHDEEPNWGRAEILKRHIADIMPDLAEQETSRWMGQRPTMPDFLPVLGPAPGCKNLYLAFGHHHLGLTLAPVTAAIMRDLIVTGRPPIDIEAFNLKRFN